MRTRAAWKYHAPCVLRSQGPLRHGGEGGKVVKHPYEADVQVQAPCEKQQPPAGGREARATAPLQKAFDCASRRPKARLFFFEHRV